MKLRLPGVDLLKALQRLVVVVNASLIRYNWNITRCMVSRESLGQGPKVDCCINLGQDTGSLSTRHETHLVRAIEAALIARFLWSRCI